MSFAHFPIGLFLLLTFVSSLYILDPGPSSALWFKIFPQPGSYLSILSTASANTLIKPI